MVFILQIHFQYFFLSFPSRTLSLSLSFLPFNSVSNENLKQILHFITPFYSNFSLSFYLFHFDISDYRSHMILKKQILSTKWFQPMSKIFLTKVTHSLIHSQTTLCKLFKMLKNRGIFHTNLRAWFSLFEFTSNISFLSLFSLLPFRSLFPMKLSSRFYLS